MYIEYFLSEEDIENAERNEEVEIEEGDDGTIPVVIDEGTPFTCYCFEKIIKNDMFVVVMYIHNIGFLVASGAHMNMENEVVVASPVTMASVQNMSDAVSSLSLSGAEHGEGEPHRMQALRDSREVINFHYAQCLHQRAIVCPQFLTVKHAIFHNDCILC